jgi:hypothetical protein
VIAQDAVSLYPAVPSVKPLRRISGNIATISRSAHYGGEDAKDRAGQYAQPAGLHLGKLISISEARSADADFLGYHGLGATVTPLTLVDVRIQRPDIG